MKRAGIAMVGLLLPLGQAWSSEGATTSGWQLTPFFGYSSA
ncbi:MAG: outer membrane beta-barrel protein, partial [Aeromonas sobria]